MWTDRRPSYRPPKLSASPWWLAVALVLGIWIGIQMSGGSVQSHSPHASHPERSDGIGKGSPFPLTNDSAAIQAPTVARREEAPRTSQSTSNPTVEPSSATKEVYLCKAYAGGIFWSSAICSTQRATIDRIVTVPGSLTWPQAVEAAERQRRAMASLYAPANVATTAGGITHTRTAADSPECASLKLLIDRIDEAARRPQSEQAQDSLRRQRHSARDREMVLRC
jgi:hypothetical protein